jgi:hypothetical protein
MKTIFLIIGLGLLCACTNQETPKSTIPYGSNHQWESIRKDIEAQIASLSYEDKLELCLLDFSFASPDYYKKLQEDPPKNVKTTLLANEVFVKICKSRNIDPNDIHEDYFSPYK